MSISDIEHCVQKIRKYTAENTELQQAHHFSFDVIPPQSAPLSKADIVILGLNQAAYAKDGEVRQRDEPMLEDTSLPSNFRNAGDLRSANRWYAEVERRIGTTPKTVLGELFFWSSKNEREMYERYPNHKRHFEFCRDLNLELLEIYDPKIVIVLRATYLKKVQVLYGLEADSSLQPIVVGNRILAWFYRDCAQRLWIVTRHWTGSRGYTKEMKRVWETKVRVDIIERVLSNSCGEVGGSRQAKHSSRQIR